MAAKASGLDAIETLLASGASVGAEDFHGWTPLHLVAQREDDTLSTIVRLLEAGASPDATNSEDTTPLHMAAAYTSDPEVLKLLLMKSEEPCVADAKGRTVLMLHDENSALKRDETYWDLHERCR